MNKIKLHLHKHIFYDLLLIIAFLLITYVLAILTRDILDNYKNNYSSVNYEESVKEAYKDNPSLFKFNSDGISKIKVEDLLEIQDSDGNITGYIPITAIKFTKKQDQCVGYIIVKKIDDDLQIDTSHICDMIDY